MNQPPTELVFCSFGVAEDPLLRQGDTRQARYLRRYLGDLGAKSVVLEPVYFDRDYLAEFAAFYCTSVAGYPNHCQRAHYFSKQVDRATFAAACGGDESEAQTLQSSYLGFVVIRPIPGARFGRTVLRWYPQQEGVPPRVTEPEREYVSNVSGLRLRVSGLAWQQQDVGVGACATVALWTMLHSSAFDDRHVVPTTAEVGAAAHRTGASVVRPFPSDGLRVHQILSVLRDGGFAPLVVEPNLAGGVGFSRDYFAASLSALLRSGYPVIIAASTHEPQDPLGLQRDGRHAVCAVGFRQASSRTLQRGDLALEDENTEFVYLHDDNLGPSVRFRIGTLVGGEVILRADSPPARHQHSLEDPAEDYWELRPTLLLAATHDDVRLAPALLHRRALELGQALIAATGGELSLAISSRILRRARYVRDELGETLAARGGLLARTRLAVWEGAPRMSQHVGLLRFGTPDGPLLDVLLDTSDSEVNLRAFCHVAYDANIASLVEQRASQLEELNLACGIAIHAF